MALQKFLQIFTVVVCFAILSQPVLGARELSSLNEQEKSVVEYVSKQLGDKLGPYRNEIMQWARNMVSDIEPMNEYVNCDICLPAVTIVRLLVNILQDPAVIEFGVIEFCKAFLDQTDEICDGTIKSFAGPLIFIVKNKTETELSNTDLCGIINPGCHPVSSKYTDWEITIPGTKPPVENLAPVPAGETGVKIFQFTDLHIDLDYQPGTPTNCQGPICCRNETVSTGDGIAGIYGSYSCALPVAALDAILDHAAELHPDVEYIFLTGDYIHSGVWLYNETENSRHIRAVTSRVKAKFPGKKIIPITGNHEAAPCNQYPPPEVWGEKDHNDKSLSAKWIYEATIEDFPDLFDGIPEQKENFLRGGYYTVTDPATKLRLVMLNSNLCYIENFWLAYDPIDPTRQLRWFADTMYAAEEAKENVLILSHIMPGSGSCWPVWSDRYDKIVNRFENIIRGQFYGHSHTDYYALSFERGTDRPTAAHFVAPSMLTDSMPSAFRVYYADGNRGVNSTWEILDYETHILDTYKSNEAEQPVFEHLYSAKEIYGLDSFRPQALYDLSLRMIRDYSLYEKYERFHVKNTTSGRLHKCGRPGAPGSESPECIVNKLCETFESLSGDNSHCGRLYEEMADFLKPNPPDGDDTTTTAATTTAATTPTVSTTTAKASALFGSGPILVSMCVALLYPAL